jgi:ribonuclease BN (tRNA processing enzyme)
MSDCYFPITLSDLSATISFTYLNNKPIKIGKTKITTLPLRHPNGVLGFRIEDNGKVLTIATDCEHPENGECDSNLLILADNTDLLIYDGQYTPEEYEPSKFNLSMPAKKGFGHSTAEEGIKVALKAKAKQLVITHHEPAHDDKMLTSMENKTKKLLPNIIFAKEGMEIVL